MVLEWLVKYWLNVAIPAVVFLAFYVLGLWLTRSGGPLSRLMAKMRWEGQRLVVDALRRPLMLWVLLLGVAIAVQVSILPFQAKVITVKVVGSAFALSFGWFVIVLSEKLYHFYLTRAKAPPRGIVLATNITRIIIIIVTLLIVLDIWGAPTTPFFFLMAVAILAAALALRNVAPNLFAGLQLSSTQTIKAGDYIKLETGEEGYVVEVSASNTRLRGLDESIVIVPNSRLLQQTVINYGHPLKKAREPFRFSSRVHLTELTGIRARNLRELIEHLKKAPDAMIYYHTHRFLEEHQYLTPVVSNDFAIWVSDALGYEVLGERLASVDTFSFPNLGALRSRLVTIIEEFVSTGLSVREALPGREFYFMKSVSAILTTPYAVHDLREFAAALRKISLGSLFFHIFESRLRLGRGLNDFSIWLKDSLEEEELAEEIARLDPYTYTLEGLRLALTQLIEKRIA